MAVSINPQRIQENTARSSSIAVQTSGDFLLFSAIVFVLAIAAGWGGLVILKASVRSQIESINTERAALTGVRSADKEAALLSAAARVDNLDQMLRSHTDGRAAFTLLQDRVQPGVVLRDYSVDYEAGIVRASLTAVSFSAIAQQLLAFQQDSRVLGIHATDFSRSADSGLFTTHLELTVRADALRTATH